MRRGTPYFRNILRSYALAVLLPVLILCALLYQLGVVEWVESERSGRKANLMTVANMLNQRMEECANMAIMMSMEKSLLAISPDMRVDESMEVIMRLKSYALGRSFFDEIIIQAANVPLLYTSAGTVYPRVLLKDVYHFSEEDIARFEAVSRGAQRGTYYFADSDMIMTFVPFPLLSAVKTGCAVYVIGKDSLVSLMNLCVNEQDCALVLANDAGQIIYSHMGFDADAAALSRVEAGADEDIELNGKNCMVVSARIPQAGWSIYWARPAVSFLYDRKLGYILLAIIGVFLISGWFVLYLARRQYTPIRELSSLAADDNKNELESIYRAVNAYRELDMRAERQRKELRANLLALLMNDDALELGEIRRACDTLNLFADADAVRAVAVKLLKAPEPEALSEYLDKLDMDYAQSGEAYAVALKQAGEFALICPSDGANRLPDLLYAIENDMQARFGQYALIGISATHALNKLATALMEARSALDEATNDPPDNIAFYEASRAVPQLDQDFRKFEHQLAYHLRQGGAQAAMAVLDGLLKSISERGEPRQIKRYYQFRIVETVVRVVTDDSVAHYLTEDEYERLSPLLTSTLVYASDAEFGECVRGIVENVCDMIARIQAARLERASQDVCGWVDKHISDSALSLDMLSAEMGYSSAYWSRFFKEKLNMNFNDYVWRLRVEKCKELLKSTDLSIRDIVFEVGYLDASSFICRFRQQEGCTPGQYRCGENAKEQ